MDEPDAERVALRLLGAASEAGRVTVTGSKRAVTPPTVSAMRYDRLDPRSAGVMGAVAMVALTTVTCAGANAPPSVDLSTAYVAVGRLPRIQSSVMVSVPACSDALSWSGNREACAAWDEEPDGDACGSDHIE